MKTETNMPLYKVLNEQRTQDKQMGVKQKAEIEYTALAVNNLHILAEALELALNNAGKVSNCKAAYEISLRHPVTKALKEQADWYKTNFVDILNRIS